MKVRAEILSEVWIQERENGKFQDFIESNDLGLPLAFALSKEIIEPNFQVSKLIHETFDSLLSLLEVSDSGYCELSDILGDRGRAKNSLLDHSGE